MPTRSGEIYLGWPICVWERGWAIRYGPGVSLITMMEEGKTILNAPPGGHVSGQDVCELSLGEGKTEWPSRG